MPSATSSRHARPLLGAPDERCVVKRAVEYAIDNGIEPFARHGPSGNGGRGDEDWNSGFLQVHCLDQRNGGIDFTGGNGVEPDCAGGRPMEPMRHVTEPFAEMDAIGAACKKAPCKIDKESRKCK